MQSKLTAADEQIHNHAVTLSRDHRRIEAELVRVLQKIQKNRIYLKLGETSLFKYAVNRLGLTESVAYAFISVARKAMEHAALNQAVAGRTLSVAKASRIVSTLNSRNAEEMVAFAERNTVAAIDQRVAQANPKAVQRDTARFLSAELVCFKFCAGHETLKKFKRAQALVAQKSASHAQFGAVFDALLDEYLDRHDPVVKAERSAAKQVTKDAVPVSHGAVGGRADEVISVNRIRPSSKERCVHKVDRRRKPLTAAEKNAVFARDGGRCTHRHADGQRCDADRWLQIHHIHPVSAGGSNDPSNLTTLCWAHHDLAHQLSLPLDGQVTWLREPVRRYG